MYYIRSMPMKDKEMLNLYLASGWEEKRITGSHHILEKNGKIVTIPVHGKDLKKGLEKALLKALKQR